MYETTCVALTHQRAFSAASRSSDGRAVRLVPAAALLGLVGRVVAHASAWVLQPRQEGGVWAAEGAQTVDTQCADTCASQEGTQPLRLETIANNSGNESAPHRGDRGGAPPLRASRCSAGSVGSMFRAVCPETTTVAWCRRNLAGQCSGACGWAASGPAARRALPLVGMWAG